MIEFDKTYRVEREPGAETGDPYGDIVPGRFGHLYIHGPGLFGVATIGRGMAAKIGRLCRVVQDGDDGVNAVFPAELLPVVAKLIGARKRRRLTPEHKDKLAAVGRKFTSLKASPDAKGERGRPSMSKDTTLAV